MSYNELHHVYISNCNTVSKPVSVYISVLDRNRSFCKHEKKVSFKNIDDGVLELKKNPILAHINHSIC